MASFSSSSIYDKDQFAIYLKQGLHESEKLDELVTRISEVITETTCSEPQPIRELQQQLLNIQLRSGWNIPISRNAPDQVFDLFTKVIPTLSEPRQKFSLETIVNTANKMCRFVANSAAPFITSDTDMAQELVMQATLNQNAQQTFKAATANFMVGM